MPKITLHMFSVSRDDMEFQGPDPQFRKTLHTSVCFLEEDSQSRQVLSMELFGNCLQICAINMPLRCKYKSAKGNT